MVVDVGEVVAPAEVDAFVTLDSADAGGGVDELSAPETGEAEND